MLNTLKRPNFVLLACQPKCASTFIANALSALPDSRGVSLVPGYDRREQELCEYRLRRYRFRRSKHLIAQAHVRHSDPTDRLIDKYGIKVLVLTRNPFDTVVSLRDHVRQESERFPFAHFTEAHRALTDKDLDMAIVRFVLPWVLSFRVGWSDHPAAVHFDYDTFSQNKLGVLSLMAGKAGIAASEAEITSAYQIAARQGSRLNIGETGRGQSLPADVIGEISRLATAYGGGERLPILADFYCPETR